MAKVFKLLFPTAAFPRIFQHFLSTTRLAFSLLVFPSKFKPFSFTLTIGKRANRLISQLKFPNTKIKGGCQCRNKYLYEKFVHRTFTQRSFLSGSHPLSFAFLRKLRERTRFPLYHINYDFFLNVLPRHGCLSAYTRQRWFPCWPDRCSPLRILPYWIFFYPCKFPASKITFFLKKKTQKSKKRITEGSKLIFFNFAVKKPNIFFFLRNLVSPRPSCYPWWLSDVLPE